MVFAADFALGEALWSIFVFFMFILWFWLLISILSDLFRDHETSGWSKALWMVALIFFPLISAFFYLVVRGDGMAERRMADSSAAKAQFDAYIRDTAGSGGPASELANAKALLDQGAIDQAEYDSLKRAILA